MRKQNSEFITAFTSEADQVLKNTDSFAFVELDDLACYVIADGIDDKVDAKSARLAVDSIIAAFTEAPSMTRRSLNRYMNIANQALVAAKSRRRLKASVTVVVHDYVKLRYAQAGNTRLRLYRSGFVREQSVDQSLSMELVKEDRLSKDKLAVHQERNNLYCFVGQEKEFAPFISKKIKLTNTDAISLYTRGIWENLDEGELADALADASNEPKETVDTVEDMLFSKQPKPLDKYTLVVLFVNKVFEDPNRKRRIKKILMIAIPIALLLVILIVVLVVQHNKRMDQYTSMNTGFLSAVAYIQADNYIRAKEDCQNALGLAQQLKDAKMQEEAGNYLRLIESIVAGDDYLNDSRYKDALIQYKNALNQARFADNVATDYITDRLEQTSSYISVYDLITLGDALSLNKQYERAEEKYLQAKSLASSLYFDKGRELAVSALEKLYGDKNALQEEREQAVQEQAQQQAGAASILAEGDKAFAQGDYEGALVFYLTALQKYEELADSAQTAIVQQKVNSTQKKLDIQTDRVTQAEAYLAQGDAFYEKKEYYQAKKYYLLAQDVYVRLNYSEEAAAVALKIDLVNIEIDIIDAQEAATETQSPVASEPPEQEAGDAPAAENSPAAE